MNTIKVKDVMTPNPRMIRPEQTVEEAAQIMKEEDVGVLPIGIAGKVLGVITDRDIVVRVIAEGKAPHDVKVEHAMTGGHIVCNEEDDLEHAAELMRINDVSRILVADRNTITGIATIADLLRNKGNPHESDKVLHHLLGRKRPERTTKAASACTIDDMCGAFDDVL